MNTASANITPTNIRRLGEKGLEITWSDGITQKIDSEVLRRNCPCAVCREERGDASHAKPLSPPTSAKKSLLKVIEHTAEESTRLMQVFAIGNYAIGIEWADKHSTGIYSYSLLVSLR